MRVLMLIICLLLTACGTPTYKVVYDVPEINLPPEPKTHLQALTDKSTPDEVTKAWVAAAVAYKGWHDTVKKQIANLN